MSRRAWFVILFVLAACLFWLAVLPNPHADAASPAQPDDAFASTTVLADPGGVGGGDGQVQYCPDTGRFVSKYQTCPSLRVGPYLPGGLRPNESDDDA